MTEPARLGECRASPSARPSHCPPPLVAPGPLPAPVPPGAAAAAGVLPDSVLGPVGGLSPPLFSAGVEPAGVVLPLGSAAGWLEPPHATHATLPSTNAATRFDRSMFRFSLASAAGGVAPRSCRWHAKLSMVAHSAARSSQPSASLIAEAAAHATQQDATATVFMNRELPHEPRMRAMSAA
jgi:hypothetical protein